MEDFVLRFAWAYSYVLTEAEYISGDVMTSILSPLEVFRYVIIILASYVWLKRLKLFTELKMWFVVSWVVMTRGYRCFGGTYCLQIVTYICQSIYILYFNNFCLTIALVLCMLWNSEQLLVAECISHTSCEYQITINIIVSNFKTMKIIYTWVASFINCDYVVVHLLIKRSHNIRILYSSKLDLLMQHC